VDDQQKPEDAVNQVAAAITRLALEEDGLGVVVVGMPARLDGSASDETRRAQAFVAALKQRINIPIVEEDERLTSLEAQSRLAVRERDWRKRKARLDSAAAAVILQDYLDRHHA
jgi:putative Holliday junction resolvase